MSMNMSLIMNPTEGIRVRVSMSMSVSTSLCVSSINEH